MDSLFKAIKDNPVRIYGILAALLPIIAIYVTTLPVGMLLALAAAILGLSEVPRQLVTPNQKVAVDVREVGPDQTAIVVPKNPLVG